MSATTFDHPDYRNEVNLDAADRRHAEWLRSLGLENASPDEIRSALDAKGAERTTNPNTYESMMARNAKTRRMTAAELKAEMKAEARAIALRVAQERIQQHQAAMRDVVCASVWQTEDPGPDFMPREWR